MPARLVGLYSEKNAAAGGGAWPGVCLPDFVRVDSDGLRFYGLNGIVFIEGNGESDGYGY